MPETTQADVETAPETVENTPAKDSGEEPRLVDQPNPIEAHSTQSSSRLERFLRGTINVLLVFVVAGLAFLYWDRFHHNQFSLSGGSVAQAGAQAAAAKDQGKAPAENMSVARTENLQLAPVQSEDSYLNQAVMRLAQLDTIIPTRPRVDVITYTVQTGDSLFSIADKFGLKPETILWGNFDTLEDNPHLLSTGQVLNILPTNGTYYKWQKGDNLNAVASFFGVDSKDILDYPGNQIDLTAGDATDPGIDPDTWLIVPNGKRAIKDWGPPAISRSNPASARYYGPGFCGQILSGAVGTGTFIWPTTEHFISGYSYSSIHPAIDIGGALGNAVYAADSGVVVYSGWSNYGYGNLIVIDHGNGWQTAYAHLSAAAVTCGQSVFQGGYIGALGSTGNSTGPHLHFELVYNGAKPNPLDYLP